MKSLACGEHGRQPWNGEVVCGKCGRVYTTHDPTLATHAPLQCTCGVQLMPSNDSKPFSARSCCSACFDAKRKAS